MSPLRQFILILILASAAYAQDSTVIISPRVGTTIDSVEAATFRILQQFKGFQEAAVSKGSDKVYRLTVIQRERSGALRDTTLVVSPALLHTLYIKITYHEQLMAGTFTPGQDSSAFLLETLEMAGPTQLGEARAAEGPGGRQPPRWSDSLPIGTGPSLYDEYPCLSFSVAASLMRAEVDGVAEIVQSIEDGYRQQGYTISQRAEEPTLPTLLPTFGLGLAVSRELRFLLEAAKASTDNEGTVSYLALTAIYTPDNFSSQYLRAGVGGGIVRWTNNLTKSFFYGTSDRISPIDTLGQYEYISQIAFIGGGYLWGGTLFLTGEVLYHGFPILTAFVQYVESPASTTAFNGQEYTVRLKRFSVGARLAIHF